MNIKIYQINSGRDTKNALFLGYERLEKFTGSSEVDSSIYDKVYDNNVDCRTLEGVYTMFNTNRPPEFTGHSLSVSDVVEVAESIDDVEKGFYFCDSIGFKKIDFEPEKTQIKDVEKIRVVMVELDKEARVVELENNLRAMQHAVLGPIELLSLFDDGAVMLANEEGKLSDLPLNRGIYNNGELFDAIAGNFFICATDGENFTSLSDKQIDKYMELYKEPEQFLREKGKLTAVKVKPALTDVIADASGKASNLADDNSGRNDVDRSEK